MAIKKITAPLAASPSVFVQPVINQLACFLNAHYPRAVVHSGKIVKGSLFSIGGAMFVADGDTAISGTVSNYIAITASGDTATAAYVSTLPATIAFNGAYSGYYDASGNLYLFDESDAINDGYITTRYYVPVPTFESPAYTAGNIIISAASGLPAHDIIPGEKASLTVTRSGIVTITMSYSHYSIYSGSYGSIEIRKNGTAISTVDTVEDLNTHTTTINTTCAAGDIFVLYGNPGDDEYINYVTFTIGSGIV